MAESDGPNRGNNKRRQGNPFDFESDTRDGVELTGQGEQTDESNPFLALAGGYSGNSGAEGSSKRTPQKPDVGEEPTGEDGSRKKTKGKRFLFWRKKGHHQSKSAPANEGLDQNSNQAETARAVPSSLESEPNPPHSSSEPQPSTSSETWAAEEREKVARNGTETENAHGELFPPKNTPDVPLQQAGPGAVGGDPSRQAVEDTDKKKSVKRQAKRILRISSKSKAMCPNDNPAADDTESQRQSAREAASRTTEAPEINDAHEEPDPLDDYEHTCAICYDLMVRPHAVRPCGHVFCEGCLRQLQHTTATRARPRAPSGGPSVTVLCPICRAPIQKCEMKEELDDTAWIRYPIRYKERRQELMRETRKLKNSRLPSSAGVPYHGIKRYRIPARNRHRQPDNHRMTRLQRFWFEFKIALLHFVWLLVVIIGSFVLGTYLSSMVISVGLLKLCFACMGKGGLVFDGDLLDARSPISFHCIRAFSLVLALSAVKMFLMLSWGKLFYITLLVLLLSVTGYCLDGNTTKTVRKVCWFSLSHPFRADDD